MVPPPATADKDAQSQRTALIEEIESAIELPEGSSELSNYTRYYAYDGSEVVGVYLAMKTEEEGAVWLDDVEELPMVLDGGCSVVSFTYDPKKPAILGIGCNGVA